MASLTLTIPDAYVPRVLDAFTARINGRLPPGQHIVRATAEDVRQEILRTVADMVRRYETDVAKETAAGTITDVPLSQE